MSQKVIDIGLTELVTVRDGELDIELNKTTTQRLALLTGRQLI